MKNGDDPPERYIIASKMSFLGKEVTPVRFVQDEKFRIEYLYDDSPNLEMETAGSADASEADRDPKSKAIRTEAFLKELLKDGPMDSKDVKRAVDQSEFSMRTVNRVKDGIVVIERQPDRSSIWRQ